MSADDVATKFNAVDAKLDTILAYIQQQPQRDDEQKKRFDSIDDRIGRIESQLEKLATCVKESNEDLATRIDRIFEINARRTIADYDYLP